MDIRKVILFKDDEGDWIAHFEDEPGLSAFGSTQQEAIKEFSNVLGALNYSLANLPPFGFIRNILINKRDEEIKYSADERKELKKKLILERFIYFVACPVILALMIGVLVFSTYYLGN